MTEGSQKIFSFLKKNYGQSFSTSELCDELDISPAVINGFILGNAKKGYVQVEKKNISGYEGVQRFISLTETGYAYDPEEEIKKKEEEKLRAKSEKHKNKYLKRQERLIEFYGGKK